MYQTQCFINFDEVISGFRVGFEGAAGFVQIQPDIGSPLENYWRRNAREFMAQVLK